jgi:hypothetical protein
MAYTVQIPATLADLQEVVDDALSALARQDLSTPRAERAAAEADYAAAQDALRMFRDRWCRGGRGVRGGTV